MATKNIITRESCKQEILHICRADVRYNIVLLIAFAPLYVPLIIFGAFSLKENLLIIIPFVAFLAIPIMFGYLVFNAIRIKREVEQGAFSVLIDIASYLSEGEVVGRNRTADVIHFAKFGRYIPSKTVFDMTSEGDEFYIVVINRKKKVPVLVFSRLLYEYVE